MTLEQARNTFVYCINIHPSLQAREKGVFIEIVRGLTDGLKTTIDRNAIAKKLGTSRMTVDRAVRSLKNKGFIILPFVSGPKEVSIPQITPKILSNVRSMLNQEIKIAEERLSSINEIIIAIKE